MKTKTDTDNITLQDAAKMLNCTKRTIQNAIARGKIKAVRCGVARHAYYVTRASIEAIMKGGDK